MPPVFKTFIQYSWILLLQLLPIYAAACSVCGCGDPVESASSSPPLAGRLMFGLGWENLSTQAASDGNPNRRETLNQTIYQFELAWDPSNKLSLLLRLPYNAKHTIAFGGNSPDQSLDSNNLGDLVLAGHWAILSSRSLWRRSSTWLAVNAGLSTNTGPNNLLDEHGTRLDEHAQPGTGALGPFAGLQLGLERGDLLAKFHLDGQIRTTNSSGYQYGNAIRAGVGVHGSPTENFTLGFDLEGRYADYDHDYASGTFVENSGGALLNIVPSFGIQLGVNWGLLFKAQLPLFQFLFGEQLAGPDYTISGQYIFF